MNYAVLAQHVVDQVSAADDVPRLFTATVRELDPDERALVDEFEPGSGFGGFDRRTGEIVLSPDFIATADPASLRLAVRHAIGCAQFRNRFRRRLVDQLLPMMFDGCAAVGMVSSPLAIPTPPIQDFGVRAGSATARRDAVSAGDSFCWTRSDSEDRRAMVERIAGRDCAGAPARLTALSA